MAKSNDFEKALRGQNPFKIGEFVTRAGLSANYKLELDNDFLRQDVALAMKIAENLAEQMSPYDVHLIVPVPKGANYLGDLVAKHLGVCYLEMGKNDKGDFHFRSPGDRAQASRKESIGLVDDVFTSGGALRDLSSLPEFKDKVKVAGVIWDRSDGGIPKKLDFDLVSVIERYIPLRVVETA